MKDRVVEFASRYRMTKVAGTDDIYDFTPVPGTVTEEGTFINKATLLQDETAEYYGFDDTATPDDVFRAILPSARAKIVVTAEVGCTVTGVSAAGDAVSFREVAEGTYRAYVSVGTWTVAAVGGEFPLSRTIEVEEVKQYNVNLSIRTLNDNSWETISEISQEGTGDTYWDIGDAKEITLNGSIGSFLSFSNKKLCVFILDFNHPENGVAENNIIWGGFKSAVTNGVDVALIDSKYSPNASGATYTDGQKHFTMNHSSNTNSGGWKGCDFRYDILGACSSKNADATAATLTNPPANTLLAVIEGAFRSVLRLRKHWVDNVGNSSNVDANVTAVTDAVSNLAEFEYFGSRSGANQYEQNHQKAMAYYAAGNSKIRKKHTDNATAVRVWLASPRYNDGARFQLVYTDGNADGSNAYSSLALAPVFKT